MKETEAKDKLGLLYLFIGIVLVLWIANLLLFLPYIKKLEFQGAGEVGDIFGAANSLFSGLAMAGIIFTILLQKKELKLQREELRATREEFTQQNTTLKLQRFENTFFQLVRLHQENVLNLSIWRKGPDPLYDKLDASIREKVPVEIKGRNVFDTVLHELYSEFPRYQFPPQYVPDRAFIDLQKKLIDEKFTEYFLEYGMPLEHYFNTLFEIFMFVDKSNLLAQPDKQFYLDILRAQLTPDEQYLLAYYSLSDAYGYPEMKFLIDKYDFVFYAPNLNYHFKVFEGYQVKDKPEE